MLKRALVLFSLFLLGQFLAAQAPKGYYSSTKGEKGAALKTAMHHIIKHHEILSYNSLLDHFKKTDLRPNGEVWDMYSNTTHYHYSGKTTRYSGEGAGFNREHSFPKSWFGGKISPMYSDIFHLYPTDGYINNRRGHLPFGETDGDVYQSNNGWSKVGVSKLPGTSERVFEPNDEYKGDFARTYFYMATCYEDKIASWEWINNKKGGEKVPMLNQTSYPCFQKWALDMLLRWAKEDPVSEKEINRNNAAAKIQGNRNPYIDFPGLEQYVWGDKSTTAFDPDNFDGESGGGEVNPEPEPNPNPEEQTVAKPVFSLASGEVKAGTSITISSATAGASIYYRVNHGELRSDYSPAHYTINEDVEIEAYAMAGTTKSETVTATYTIAKTPVVGKGVFERVNSNDELQTGYRYLIVCESENVAMAASKTDIRSYAEVSITDHVISTEVGTQGQPYAFVLEKDGSGYTLYDEADATYLALTQGGNKLNSVSDKQLEEAHWNISVSGGLAQITNWKQSTRAIKYNASAPRFATYTSGQVSVSLYKETVSGEQVKVSVPEFSVPGGEVEKGTPLTISCATAGADICYAVNGGEWQTALAPVQLKIDADMTVKAYAMLGEAKSEEITVAYTVKQPVVPVVEVPVFSVPSCDFEEELEVTISCVVPTDTVYYKINNGIWYARVKSCTLTLNNTAVVSAYTQSTTGKSEVVEATYTKSVIDAVDSLEATSTKVNVYTVDGRLLREQVAKCNATLGLHPGIYIIEGKKVVVR